ncbi:noggin-1-like isoform X1 [Chiloscyllium plagiosum]|uniref:noggin-1-like isoform X1 n=1 Tax=Chiloscyllium plagiosum TaxID=36176 RepID=UPI001CB7BF9B|nr:noggin-1-like isoform X1 [Chiloscyllium plagiosum]
MPRELPRTAATPFPCQAIIVFLLLHSGSSAQPRSRSADAQAGRPGTRLRPTPRPGSEAETAWGRMKVSNSVRPYSLSLSDHHYRYSPRPKQLDPKRLRKLLGPSFDPFWMSVTGRHGNESERGHLLQLSGELAAAALRLRGKLWHEAQRLEPAAVASEADKAQWRRWLVREAVCPLTSQWVDLGAIFWPRWVRHTDCDRGRASCFWPPGMSCTQAEWAHIKLLVWHCWTVKERGRVSQQCTWSFDPQSSEPWGWIRGEEFSFQRACSTATAEE